MKRLSNYRLAAIAGAVAMAASAAMAEQTIGIQDGASTTDAIATARVNIRVLVPKIVILRVGDAANTQTLINFTYGVGALTTGDSQVYAGAIPPTLTNTTTRTDPNGSDGQVVVGAWSNVAGTTLACAVSNYLTTTPFGAAGTVAGVPGRADIGVTVGAGANQLPHPGTGGNLADCVPANTQPLTVRTAYTGTYTYAPAASLVPANLNPGTYGLTVTYTATAP
ncbi:MAG: hypothetical protein K0R58_2417 [Ramlibacter sp.]|jgi:hypothetical protein|nr:hypothetical protein [Ramlibacter sp.]